MNTGSTDSRGTIAIVLALVALIIVAFVVGGLLLGEIQGLYPEIVRERARAAQLENDKAAELNRHQKLENEQRERDAALAYAQREAFGDLLLSVAREWGMESARAVPVVVVIVTLALAARFIMQSNPKPKGLRDLRW